MSNVHFSIMSGFKAVNAWQANILRNAQGLLLPGYNKTTVRFGSTPSGHMTSGLAGTGTAGSQNAMPGGADTLTLTAGNIVFQQGNIDPSFSPTALAIKGGGFFMLAENLRPGAKIYLSRNGDFKYDTQGRLVNSQGLFVVGGFGNLTDPPTPVRNPGDGSVRPDELTLGTVRVASQLAISGYGPLVYETTRTSGAFTARRSGDTAFGVGFVQTNSLEMPNPAGVLGEIQVESSLAQNTYKIFKDMLDNYNKATDDAIGTVR